MIYNKVRAGVRGCGEAATVRLIDNLGWGESRDAARADGVVGTCRCRVSVVGIRAMIRGVGVHGSRKSGYDFLPFFVTCICSEDAPCRTPQRRN